MQESKIATYLGFCIKSGKAALGLDRAETLKRSANLVLTDKSLSEGSMKRAKKLCQKFNCPLLICEGVSLGNLLHRPACKLIAVSEKNLAAAILSEAENNENFKLLNEVGIGGTI